MIVFHSFLFCSGNNIFLSKISRRISIRVFDETLICLKLHNRHACWIYFYTIEDLCWFWVRAANDREVGQNSWPVATPSCPKVARMKGLTAYFHEIIYLIFYFFFSILFHCQTPSYIQSTLNIIFANSHCSNERT